MSLESWKKEFYPITAAAAAAIAKTDEIDDHVLLSHSLKKWEGLRQENLQAHGLVQRFPATIQFGAQELAVEGLRIDSESCALCAVYLQDSFKECGHCPLYRELGHRCDNNGPGIDHQSPYRVWLLRGTPEPMIEALQSALLSL